MRNSFVVSLLLSTSIGCSAAPASVESINTLLTVSKSETLIAAVQGQVGQAVDQSLAQALNGRQLSQDQRRILDTALRQVSMSLKEELSWARMSSMYVNIYREAFTQEEIDGMIAFYRSPAGMASIDKMPFVLQKSSAAMQARLPQLTEKINATLQKALAEAGIKE